VRGAGCSVSLRFLRSEYARRHVWVFCPAVFRRETDSLVPPIECRRYARTFETMDSHITNEGVESWRCLFTNQLNCVPQGRYESHISNTMEDIGRGFQLREPVVCYTSTTCPPYQLVHGARIRRLFGMCQTHRLCIYCTDCLVSLPATITR
jgi:hypothetical protein